MEDFLVLNHCLALLQALGPTGDIFWPNFATATYHILKPCFPPPNSWKSRCETASRKGFAADRNQNSGELEKVDEAESSGEQQRWRRLWRHLCCARAGFAAPQSGASPRTGKSARCRPFLWQKNSFQFFKKNKPFFLGNHLWFQKVRASNQHLHFYLSLIRASKKGKNGVQ